jgi:hypothetical protein
MTGVAPSANVLLRIWSSQNALARPITIRMFFSDHPPPHFHVAYQRHRAVIAIQSGAIIGGVLPPAVHRLVREWAGRHRAELIDNWERARTRRALQRIPGADVE